MQHLFTAQQVARIEVLLDDAPVPFQTVVPPGTLTLDTTKLDDGPHVLRLLAYDANGNVGRRTISFVVQNGPGITVTGLRAGERVGGSVNVEINAFGANEPFDPIRAESSGPIPVWTWVLSAVIVGWSVWYGLASFSAPPQYASTPTYERDPVAAANMPMSAEPPAKISGGGVVGGFDYAASGERLYGVHCAACHGARGNGVPGTFPPLSGDPVVTVAKPDEHVHVILAGLKGKSIGGKTYAAEMPAFPQLSDTDIAAIVDHERTSWGNHAPIITPDVVKRAR